MARNITHAFLFLSAVVAFLVMGGSMAYVDHIVGGSKGWRLPENSTFYVNWAQTRNFSLGDKLVFPFRSGVYNIMEVSEEDFDKCTQKNVSNWYPKGPTIIELTEPGKHYYYCGVGRHCEAGQKLSIDVSATPALDPYNTASPLHSPTNSATSLYVKPTTGLLVFLLCMLLMFM